MTGWTIRLSRPQRPRNQVADACEQTTLARDSTASIKPSSRKAANTIGGLAQTRRG
jgi:hypothetical protein